MKHLFLISLLFALSIIVSCSSEQADNACITLMDCNEGEICQLGECVPGEVADTGDTSDSDDTGVQTDTGSDKDSIVVNDSDTGSANDSDAFSEDADILSDFDSMNEDSDVIDGDTDSPDEDVYVPECGNQIVDEGESCDKGEENVAPGYSDSQVCSTECAWNPYCGDAAVDYKRAVFAEDTVVLRLDEESLTEAVDSSPNAFECTVEGATRVAGKFGNALNFTGTCSYDTSSNWVCENSGKVYWTYSAVPSDNFTMMAWVKAVDEHEIDAESNTGTPGTKGQRYLFGADHGQDLAGAGVSVGTNGISVYEHGSGYMPAVAVYEAGIGTGWNHIAVVYTDRQPSIYLNGKLVRTGVVSGRTTVYAPTTVGSGDYGNFNGTVDEVRIVSKSMSEEEIRLAMGEVCDEGEANNKEVSYGTAECNIECMINSYCGDAVVDSGETCDDGTFNGESGKCKSDCSGYSCAPGTWTFSYTGSSQTFTAQYAGTYTFEVWGAQGGNGYYSGTSGTGGHGGYAKGSLTLTEGQIVYVYVGQQGVENSGTSMRSGAWNGGGIGYGRDNGTRGSGGGASDIRIGGTELTNRIIVAGGGGGAYSENGGAGGGTTGGNGTGGNGGTQTAGGSGYEGWNGTLGQGGGVPSSSDNTEAGGGGGYYGGGAGNSAGGGSGYIGGVTSGTMSSGVRSGNGQAVITLTCP